MSESVKPGIFETDEDGRIIGYYGEDEVIVIPDGATDIFFEVFTGNTRVTKLVIPGSITDVTALEFEQCTALREVIIQNGTESIGPLAFSECTALTRVLLPSSLKRIGDLAFSGCSSLKELCFAGQPQEWSLLQKERDWDKGTGDYKVIFGYTDNQLD